MEDKENNALYKMELHEQMGIRNGLWVTRVPGGWIYEYGGINNASAPYAVFVPYNDDLLRRTV